MKRRWKLVIGAGITATTVVIAVVVATPFIARRIMLHQLATAGWPHATIDRVHVGWNTATISGIDLTGSQQATARRITSDWMLNSVVIDGLAIILPDADWQPLLPKPTSQNSPGSSTPFTWPIGQLSLMDSSVIFGEQQASVEATIVRLQPDRVQVTGDITLEAIATNARASITIDGSVTLTGDGDLHLKLMQVPLTIFPPKLLPGSAEGTLTSDLRLTRAQSTVTVAGDVSIHQPGYAIPLFGQVHADHVGGRVRWSSAEPTAINGDLKITTAHANLFGVAVVVPSANIRCADQRIDAISHFQALGADISLDGHCSTDFATAAGTVRIDGLDLTALAGLARPWMSLPITAQGNAGIAITFTKLADTWRGSGVVSCTEVRLATTDAATHLRIPNAVTELSATWIDNALNGTAVLRINHAEVQAPGIHIASIDGTLPWSIGRDPQLDGSLQFTGVEVYGFPLRQLAAHVRGVDRRIGGAAYVGVLDTGRGRIDGWYDLQKHGGTFGVVVPRFTIRDPAAVRNAVPGMGPRDLTGEVDLSGTVVVANNQVIPDLRVSLAEGSFSDPLAKLTVNGLAASTLITGFTPFSTAGTKQVAFRSATIGSLAFGDGTARVTARLPVGVDITEASIAWCGGRIKIPELAVDLQKNHASGTIELARIELGALLRATIPRQLSGEGLISGTLPLTLTWPDYIFTFGRGSLQADPATGWLHLKDRTALVSAIATGFAVVDAQIVDTVSDLLFDALRVDFVPENPLTSVAKIHVSGQGRNGDPPLAIGGLDLNVRGLERALADALFMQRWQSQVSDAQAASNSTIDSFFSP